MRNQSFFLLIKPNSYLCNLRCDYCFYLCKEKIYSNTSSLRMKDEVLDKIMKTYFETDQAQYNICWQGGEPTMMGLAFYEKVVAYEKKYAKKGSVIANALQTNATMIDGAWAAFLQKYHFLVGVSLDGNAGIHDLYRKTIHNKGSYQQVQEGLANLRKHSAAYNILALVNADNVKKPKEVYHTLKKQGTRFLQFTPCVEFDEQGTLMPYAITGEEWGRFLCNVFDIWIKDDIGKISVRLFDAILETFIHGSCSMCTMNQTCGAYLVIEHNGDVYPCDFFVEEEYKLGNIMTDSFEELLHKKKFHAFSEAKQKRHITCDMCPYVRFCHGDCLKNRFYHTKESDNPSWLCQGWKMFYSYALPKLHELAKML